MEKKTFAKLLCAASLFISNFYASAQCYNNYESNNTLATATTLSTSSFISAGIATSGDMDYYKVVLPSTGSLSINLSNLVTDFDLQLLNSSGGQIASSTLSSSYSERIVQVLPAGTYYIYVYGYSGLSSQTCYSLSTYFNSSTCSNTEPNNSTLQATSLSLNSNIYNALGSPGDQDYYRVALPSAGYLSLFLDNLPADYNLTLYNSSGIEVGSSLRGNFSAEYIFTYIPAAGTYYALVSSPLGQYNPYACYKIENRFNTNYCAAHFEFDHSSTNNNEFAYWDGNPISASISYAWDEDPLETFLENGDTVILYNHSIPLSLTLTNPSGSGVQNAGSASTSPKKIIASNTGLHKLNIFSGSVSYSSNCYSLKVGRVNFRKETTDSKTSNEKILAEPTIGEGLLLHPQPIKATQKLILSNLNSQTSEVRILDAKGNVVKEQQITQITGQAEINIEYLAPGIYFVNAINSGTRKLIVQ